MKGFLNIIILGLAVFTLTACGTKEEKAENQIPLSSAVDTIEQNAQPDDEGIISSIREALTASATLKCEYTDEDGGLSIVYLKDRMVRIEGTEEDPVEGTLNINGLVRDNKMYIWSDQSADGFVIDFEKLDSETATMSMGETQIRSSDDVVSELEVSGRNCQKVSVPGDFFDLPAGISWLGA